MKNNRIFGKNLLDYLYLCPIDPLLWAEKVSKTILKAENVSLKFEVRGSRT